MKREPAVARLGAGLLVGFEGQAGSGDFGGVLDFFAEFAELGLRGVEGVFRVEGAEGRVELDSAVGVGEVDETVEARGVGLGQFFFCGRGGGEDGVIHGRNSRKYCRKWLSNRRNAISVMARRSRALTMASRRSIFSGVSVASQWRITSGQAPGAA